ncbi:LITAF-like zinc ribbon domain-containing protein [Natrialba aegyptia]|uniref:LITAF domain-containing protein n=1 Tax=Natrialba aegyptia DSM 13077 TaxID=1227491 RepID=M0B8F9_9EURY|nr:LITAF-like zinc ribbon domain-containing protein [Natrialba aegyptia]ELZ06792.1 hypothetical protein C480_07162 [Natrialba aegyptia DSM 13077]
MSEADTDSSQETEPEYRCKSCKEPISPGLDDFSEWGKCPHCHNRHPQAVKTRAGISNLFWILSILLLFTVVGVFFIPFTLAIGYYFYWRTQKMLEKDEYCIGEEA